MRQIQSLSLIVFLVSFSGFGHARPQQGNDTISAVSTTLTTITSTNSSTSISTASPAPATVSSTEDPVTKIFQNNLTSTTATTTTSSPVVDPVTSSAIIVPVIPPIASSDYDGSDRSLEPRAIAGTTANGNTSHAEFDGPIRRCNHNGDINKCLRQILEDLKPRLGTGIPEINLPPMDPLYLQSVSFHHGSGPIKILATFNDVNATGLSTFDKSDFTFDVKKRTLDFDMTIPQMRIVGNYELSGNLFFFPIGGDGGFWLNMGNIRAKGQGKLSVSTKNNLKSIQIKKIDIDLQIETIKVHLTNLFHGDQLLGTVINNFLNENANEIFEEVRPQIGIQVAEMVQALTNRALSSLSDDHFADIRADVDA